MTLTRDDLCGVVIVLAVLWLGYCANHRAAQCAEQRVRAAAAAAAAPPMWPKLLLWSFSADNMPSAWPVVVKHGDHIDAVVKANATHALAYYCARATSAWDIYGVDYSYGIAFESKVSACWRMEMPAPRFVVFPHRPLVFTGDLLNLIYDPISVRINGWWEARPARYDEWCPGLNCTGNAFTSLARDVASP